MAPTDLPTKDPAPAPSPGHVDGETSEDKQLSVAGMMTGTALMFIGFLPICLLAFHRLVDRTTIPRAFALGVLLSMIGIVQKALWSGKVYGFWEPINKGVVAFGPFINRNHFATFLAMALPFALGLALPWERLLGEWAGRASLPASRRLPDTVACERLSLPASL